MRTNIFLSTLFLLMQACAPAFGATDLAVRGHYAPGLRVTKNFVKNPNCEKNTLNITSSTGSFTQQTAAPLVAGAGAKCRWNPGATGTLKFAISSLSPNIAAGNCEATFYTDTTTPGEYIAYLLYDSVKVTSNLAVNADATGRKFQIIYPCSQPGGTTTRELAIESTTAPSLLYVGGVSFGELTPGAVSSYLTTGPTVQKFLSGSSTYTTPPGVLYLDVRLLGGGGGGGGSGASPTTGGTGGTTTFGSSLLTANGGTGGNVYYGGTGGTCTVSAPAIDNGSTAGSYGSGGYVNAAASQYPQGGAGGTSPFGGAGGGSTAGNTGFSAVANSGSGGGGGSGNNTGSSYGAGGGASGCYVQAIINNPAATYAVSIGAAGTAGATGGASAGGAGGSGIAIITEHYQ